MINPYIVVLIIVGAVAIAALIVWRSTKKSGGTAVAGRDIVETDPHLILRLPCSADLEALEPEALEALRERTTGELTEAIASMYRGHAAKDPRLVRASLALSYCSHLLVEPRLRGVA